MSNTKPEPVVQEKPHLSASSINTYLTCPRKWKFRYIDKLSGPTGSNLIFGRAYHAAIEIVLKEKMDKGNELLMPWDDTRFVFHENLNNELDETDGEIKYNKGETPESMHALGETMIKVWYEEIAPTLKPVAIEEKFVVSLGDDFPYELLGYIDLIEEGDIIVDHKTSKKRWAESKPGKELQADVYLLAYYLKFGRAAREVRYDIITKGGPRSLPQAQQLSTTRTEPQLRWFIGLFEDVVYSIEKGAFPPDPAGFLCSPDWCEYYAVCKQKGGVR